MDKIIERVLVWLRIIEVKKPSVPMTCKHEYKKQLGFTNILKCLECEKEFYTNKF